MGMSRPNFERISWTLPSFLAGARVATIRHLTAVNKSTIRFSKVGIRAGILAPGTGGRLTRQVKEIPVAPTTPSQRFLPGGLPRPTVGSWRIDPARSQASFVARSPAAWSSTRSG